MKNQLFFILFILSSITLQAQVEDIKAYYYKTTKDYINNNLSDNQVTPKKLRFQTDKLIRISVFLDVDKGKRSKDAKNPWAILVDSTTYFHFSYFNSLELGIGGLYVKADMEGKYCAVFADKELLRTMTSDTNHLFGGGVQGFLIGESRKWGKNWENEKGEKIKIFIVDTSNLLEGDNTDWFILTKSNINEILGLDLLNDEIKQLSVEDIKQLIENANS